MKISHAPIEIDGIGVDVDLYPLDDAGPSRPAVLVLPGGGFREHTEHDGEGFARWLNGIGLHAVVCRYALVPDPFPLALQQSRAALAALRQGQFFHGVDPQRVGVIGSSAGGLLAGLLATGAVLTSEATPEPWLRPDFHIQAYGLVDLQLLPDAAVEALLGERMGWRDELSPSNHVDSATSPSFIWATAEDPPGLPNALEWARVLAKHDVPVELHIYPHGWHGLGLANGVAYGEHGHLVDEHTARWSVACRDWLVHRGVLPS